MKSTHWSHTDNPEAWRDDPGTDPISEAETFLEEGEDDSWDQREELISDGKCDVVLHGYIQTSKLLDPEVAFDGYEPGQEYFEPTGETITVVIARHAFLKDSPTDVGEIPRRFDAWDQDDHGDALWWDVSMTGGEIQEPPGYVGGPTCSDWPFDEDEHAHLLWVPLPKLARAKP
jgi:hypothetical protein